MAAPSLVVLAAGRGTRFGGPKQLVPVRADGATVTDVLVERAAAAGVRRVVVIVNPEIEGRMRAHLDEMTAGVVPVALVVQAEPRGTADALLAARSAIDNDLVVVNGDDLYPSAAFVALGRHLRDGPVDEHATIGFRLDRTVVGTRAESRALLTCDRADRLMSIREGQVTKDGGLRFVTATRRERLQGDELISMNMWGFRSNVVDSLNEFVARAGDDGEVFLPDAVAWMVAKGAVVRVLRSDDACIGMTYREDVAAVRAALS